MRTSLRARRALAALTASAVLVTGALFSSTAAHAAPLPPDQVSVMAASPSAPQVFVASIPNLQRMYDLNKSSLSARFAWSLLGICQSMLANPTSTKTADVERRAAVQQRVNEYNQALAEACAQYSTCRWDGGTVAGYAFSKSDISTRDYFHPSLAGQAKLAAITWAATQWVS